MQPIAQARLSSEERRRVISFRKLRTEGLKPLLLAAAAWVFISIFALVLMKLTAYS